MSVDTEDFFIFVPSHRNNHNHNHHKYNATNNPKEEDKEEGKEEEKKVDVASVDLMLVFGTSLQVAPFCAIPNLAPKYCVRVLVNRNLQDCKSNGFSIISRTADTTATTTTATHTTIRLGPKRGGARRRNVPLYPLWWSNDRKIYKRWRQLKIQDDCDTFVERFFNSDSALSQGITLYS